MGARSSAIPRLERRTPEGGCEASRRDLWLTALSGEKLIAVKIEVTTMLNRANNVR